MATPEREHIDGHIDGYIIGYELCDASGQPLRDAAGDPVPDVTPEMRGMMIRMARMQPMIHRPLDPLTVAAMERAAEHVAAMSPEVRAAAEERSVQMRERGSALAREIVTRQLSELDALTEPGLDEWIPFRFPRPRRPNAEG